MLQRLTVTMGGDLEDRKRVLAIGEAISGLDKDGNHVHCFVNPSPVTMVEMLVEAMNIASIRSLSYERHKE